MSSAQNSKSRDPGARHSDLILYTFPRSFTHAMSQSTVIEDLEFTTTTNYAMIAFAVFPLYDYLLTAGSEGTLFWRGRVPLASSILMLLIRITTVSMVITGMLSTWYGSSLATCRSTYIASAVFTGLPYVSEAVIAAVRVYALSNCNLLCTAIVFAMSISVFVVDMYELALTRYAIADDGLICDIIVPVSVNLKVEWPAYVCNTLAQAVVISITWYRLWFTARLTDRKQFLANLRRSSISWLFLRDGTIYFFTIFMLHIFNIILEFSPLTIIQSFDTVHQSMQVVLLSRLLINLRKASLNDRSSSGLTTSRFLDDFTHVSTIAFQNPGNDVRGNSLSGDIELVDTVRSDTNIREMHR
ncbi:hypothetical protein DAEQUDRAFT_812872 [Daedalea quercina L-15889]|uniref:DUF6533 domain-containing protein n=1 Tax=Daedalea quercina L-15889 TaxID=1314783 RepID=A0A165NX57_9APHY|nr:hypothetical protein DAEQUDRAFT_812872 [Daedalea quercina L-15889]